MGVVLLELGLGYIRGAAEELGFNDKLVLHQASDPETAATAEFSGSLDELNNLCKEATVLFKKEKKGSSPPWIVGEV